MTIRNVKKNLAGQQDLLPGVGPYSQIRRGVVVDVDGPAKSYIELWKDYCGEAYVGTFEDGFVTKPDCVAVSLALGKAYRYTATAEVSIPANSLVDINWVELSTSARVVQVMELYRRSYADAGYNVVGTFQAGFTIVNVNDVGIDLATGKGFTGPAGTVAAGTDPASGWFVDRSAALRDVYPESFGGVGNATGVAGVGVDSTQAFINAAAACLASKRKLVASGTYRITGDVDIRMIRCDLSNATMYIDSPTAQVRIGGNANYGDNLKQEIGAVRRVGGASESVPDIRVSGAKGQVISVESCDYLQVWASTTAPNRDMEYSCAYSNFHLKYCWKLELTSDPLNASGPNNSQPGGRIQWINECDFYLSRTNKLIVSGTYAHNHNRFHAGTFEGDSLIDFQVGRDNRVYNARFEGDTVVINFAAGTERNRIFKSYDESEFNNAPDWAPKNVTDNGAGNVVASDFRLYYKTETVAFVDINNKVIQPSAGFGAAIQPYSRCVQAKNTNPVVESGLIAAESGSYYFFNTKTYPSLTCAYRPYFIFYDNQLNLLTPSSSWVSSPTMTAVAGLILTTGIGVDSAVGRITAAAASAGVAFIKVGWRGSSSQLTQGLAHTLSVVAASKNRPSKVASKVVNNESSLVTGLPTAGFANPGETVYKSDGTARYVSTFSLKTTLAATVGQTSTITVANANSVAIGDIIGVDLNDLSTHWTKVANRSGTTITLETATPWMSNLGCGVYFVRWKTENVTLV